MAGRACLPTSSTKKPFSGSRKGNSQKAFHGLVRIIQVERIRFPPATGDGTDKSDNAAVPIRYDVVDERKVDETCPELLVRDFDESLFHGLTNLRFGNPKVRKNTARPSMAFKVWHPNTGRASLNKNK